MKKTTILAITLLVVLVMLVGMGAVACNGNGEATTTPPTGNGEATTPPPGDDEETTTPPPSEPQFTSDDGRITFVLDDVERTGVWPDELQGERVPEAGCDFIVVTVQISHIDDGHIQARSGSVIVGDDGVEYQDMAGFWQGVHFNDPQHLTAGYELIEGSTGMFVAELPEGVQPVRLELAYLFFESWTESWEPVGEEEKYIDIIFP